MRQKAWVGAAISAATGIASSLIGASAQRKAQRKQQIAENKQATIEMANNLANQYSDQSYADAYNDKLTFRTGGRFKANQVSYAKRLRCGGRKKFEDGGTKEETKENNNDNNGNNNENNNGNNNENTKKVPVTSSKLNIGTEILNAGISGIGNLISSMITNNVFQCGGKYKAKRK